MANSINTNIAAYFAQANIATAANKAASSVARLSSGNRIVQASDDVAALATGTSLQTTISALKTAQSNVSQGSSLLQVADGALAQIQTILQRQKAIALQAGSGSLTNTDRGFLDQEFQALTAQIDSLTSSTTFNGVQLINGNLATAASVTAASTNATRGSISTAFSNGIQLGESVIVNGVVLTAAATSTGASSPSSGSPLTFAVGASLSETIANLAQQLNDSAKNSTYAALLGDAVFSSQGQTLTATARSGGTLSDSFTLRGAGPVATVATNTVSTTNLSTSVTIALADTSFQVGQSIILDIATKAGIGGISADNLRGVITANDGTTITFTAQSAATSSVATTNSAGTLTLDLANGLGEAVSTGGSLGSSFNLFGVTTSLTSATQAVSADTAAASTPFENGDSITATINGVTKTLYTFGSASDGGAYTLVDIVNGINANEDSTGFGATLVYSGGTYNIRLSYDGLSGPVILSAGSNYDSSTYTLGGDDLSATTNLIGTGGYQTIVSSGYIDLTGAAGSTGITVANQTTSVVGTTAAAPFVVGESITITRNGQTETLYTVAASDTLNTIVNGINANVGTTGVYAAVTGTGGGYNIRLYTTTTTPASDQIFVDAGSTFGNSGVALADSVLTTLTTTNGGLTQTTTGSISGGADDGLGLGSVTATGAVGDNILTSLNQTKASVDLILTAVPVAGTSTLTVGGKVFSFTSTSTANAAPDEILVVSGDIEATLNNAINTIRNYLEQGYAQGTAEYELNQIDLEVVNGNTLRFTGKTLDNVTTLASTKATPAYSTISASITGSSLTNSGALSNAASSFGVDVSGITNADFSGTISGFVADYKDTASTVDLSVTIGDFTYTAEDVVASVTSDTRVRFYSNTVGGQNGGYFDIQLDGGNVLAFTTQAGADTVAQRLDSAFSSLTFYQERIVTSYTGSSSIVSGSTVIGSLLDTKVSAQLEDFSDVKISKVDVTAPSGSNTDTSIALTINGVVFTTASGIGSVLQSNQTYRLTSAEDPNQYVDFTLGDSDIDISSAEYASVVEASLSTAFGANAGTAALSFQIGAATSDTLSVSIGSASTNDLYGGATLSVATQAGAATASSVLDTAIASVTALRASVGALESRFNFAAAALQSSVQNQDAARGQLLDTDIALESTAYATEQVKLQAGISVLAQANQQLQALLKLIG